MASNPIELASSTYNPNDKQKGAGKTARIPIKIIPAERLPKPDWIRVKAGSPTTRFYEIKDILRANNLVEVEEIMDISSRLVVNQAALKLKRARLQPILEAFERASLLQG